MAELGIALNSTASTTIPLAPPLSPTSHTNPGVSGIVKEALECNSDTESTTIEVDTRPIWPHRPELIYKQYLTEKEAWLRAHPDVQPANYRTERGLEVYSRRWCNENRRYLGKDRLNLQTETLLDQAPNWTIEQISAWLDYKALEDEEIERQVEAEFIAEGGFSRERGVFKTRMAGYRANYEAQRAQYRFVP
jgi:hypothetical protein